MKKKKLRLKKHFRYFFNIAMITIILFSVNKTTSRYRTNANISSANAIPIINIESSDFGKEINFIDYGWITYNFDIINGKMGKDGLFYVNEVDMEYYIKVVKDSGDMPLNLIALYNKSEDPDLTHPFPYDEEKGFGPFTLPYKVDDELVYNPVEGYLESKYVSRVSYMLLYTYGDCKQGSQNCIIDANQAGKDYKFHLEVKAYQKVTN